MSPFCAIFLNMLRVVPIALLSPAEWQWTSSSASASAWTAGYQRTVETTSLRTLVVSKLTPDEFRGPPSGPMLLQHLCCLVASMMWCHLRTRSAGHFTLLSLRVSPGAFGWPVGVGADWTEVWHSGNLQFALSNLCPSLPCKTSLFPTFLMFSILVWTNSFTVSCFTSCVLTSNTLCRGTIATRPPFTTDDTWQCGITTNLTVSLKQEQTLILLSDNTLKKWRIVVTDGGGGGERRARQWDPDL